jgi:hypothetical protein
MYKIQKPYYKSNTVPIKSITGMENSYSLNNSSFDPTKSSPPNEFLIKIQERMRLYNQTPDKSAVSRDSE